MKKYKLTNQFITLFFVFIIFFSSVTTAVRYNIGVSAYKESSSVIEKFFALSNMPADILSKILSQENQNNANHKKKTSSADSKNINDMAFNSAELSVVNVKNIIAFTADIAANISAFTSQVTEYPLKIPFWRCIVFLLLFKLLFSVLPRSISINYYKKYRRACTLS